MKSKQNHLYKINSFQKNVKNLMNSSSIKGAFQDFSFEIKSPLPLKNLKPISKIFQESKEISFECIDTKLSEKIKVLPSILSMHLSFPHTLFNISHYKLLMNLLDQITVFEKQSISIMSFIEEVKMTPWRLFYYSSFLNDLWNNKTNLSFLSRFDEYEINEYSTIFLNSLLKSIQFNCEDLKEFVFINGNLDHSEQYPFHFEHINSIMSKFARSLEKISLFFRSAYIGDSSYIKLFDNFEEIARWNKIKSFKIALNGIEDPLDSGIREINQKLTKTFKNQEFNSIEDFGFLLARRFLSYEILKETTDIFSENMHRFFRFSFLFQSDIEFYTKDEMNQLLRSFFRNQAEDLRDFTLGLSDVCSNGHNNDAFYVRRDILFDLKDFGQIIKENEWKLVTFNLYFKVNDMVSKRDVKEFLMILMKKQKFLVNLRLMIMKREVELINNFEFSKILELYFIRKLNYIRVGKALKNLKKCYRFEIRKEIFEKIEFQ